MEPRGPVPQSGVPRLRLHGAALRLAIHSRLDGLARKALKAEADRLTWQSKCLPPRLAVNAQAAAAIGVIKAASQIYEIGDITVHQEGVKAQLK